MRRNELTIAVSVAVIAMIAGFWLLVISPKRDEAASLKGDIEGLQGSLAQAQETAAAGRQAREEFPVNYRSLVVLGKAVPADGDQAGLLVQVQRLADRSGVDFRSIDLAEGSGESTTPAPATAGSSGVSPIPPETPSTGTTEDTTNVAATTPAPATEAAAAALPIGASVGPAGLPVMPYSLTFTGDFFQIAAFLESLDKMVQMPHGEVDVTGRLLTVDGFALAPPKSAGGASSGATSTLVASLAVTTYLTPADQGVTAGATSSGPALVTSTATPTPASSTTTTAEAPTSSAPPPTP
jgi:Tfp pilus assembly protein PilO